MSTKAAETNQTSNTADRVVTIRQRGARSMKRVVLLAVVVAAGAAAVHPSSTFANVSDGSGIAYEWVNCNSNTHTITITTSSTGIQSNQIGGNFVSPYFLNYRVWLTIHEYVNGAWRAPTPWVQVTDGAHVIQFLEKAGATSYWYFTWAFETANGTIDYRGEWAQGLGSYGWYSDQRGYTTLTSCRS